MRVLDKKPNVIQKLLHRFLMLRYVSAALAVILHRVDTFVLKITDGKHSIAEIAGLPIVQLTTKGSKTGKMHTIPLVALRDGEKIALIASSFGRKHNPAWYYNLLANPECVIQAGGRSREYIARETDGAERQKYWDTAISYYAGYAKYKQRAAHRVIPVMLLEPVA